jgi:hypothetical protein
MEAREFKIGDRVYIVSLDTFGNVWEYGWGGLYEVAADGGQRFVVEDSDLIEAEAPYAILKGMK